MADIYTYSDKPLCMLAISRIYHVMVLLFYLTKLLGQLDNIIGASACAAQQCIFSRHENCVIRLDATCLYASGIRLINIEG